MGFFITIEGCEGAGKTTAIEFITQWFESKGIAYEITREPGGTPLAEDIRKLLLEKRSESVTDITELLLMFAARSQNFHEKIKPAIAAGKVVISDRFTDATYAYQGGGRGIDSSYIAQLESLVQGDYRPDLTLLLDVKPEIGLSRAKRRGGQLDRIEQENIDFFDRVRSTYLDRAQQQLSQFAVIDANYAVDNVTSQIKKVLEQRLAPKK